MHRRAPIIFIATLIIIFVLLIFILLLVLYLKTRYTRLPSTPEQVTPLPIRKKFQKAEQVLDSDEI